MQGRVSRTAVPFPGLGMTAVLALLLLVVFSLVAFVGWHQLRDISTIHDMAVKIEEANHESHHLHDLEMRVRSMVAHVHDFLITGSPSYVRKFRQTELRVKQLAGEVNLKPDERAEFDQSLERLHALAMRIFSLPFATGNMEGPILMQELDQALGRLSWFMSRKHQSMDQGVNVSMQMVRGLHLDMREDFIVSLVALFIILAGVAGYVFLRVVRPLSLLRREVGRIGRGDFSPVTMDVGDNEIGDLVRALNRMSRALDQRDRELVQAKSYAAHQEKMHALGLMTASIAHEVGNPLAAARVSQELAIRKLEQGDLEACRQQLAACMEELNRTEGIIRNVLDFGRHAESQIQDLDVHACIEAALGLVRLAKHSKRIRFGVDIPDSLPGIIVAEDVVQQVLVNLLLNAVDVSRVGDEIAIQASADEKAMYLDVSDQGGGLSREVEEKIFSPLFTTKPRGEGSGLGLAISRDLMRRMHGDLILLRNDEHGCCFRMIFPLDEGGSDAGADH